MTVAIFPRKVYLLTPVLFVLAASITFLGDVPWLLWLGFFGANLFALGKKRPVKWAILLSFNAIYSAHSLGYKIYGRPISVDNRILMNSLTITRIIGSDTLELSDGRHITLSSIRLKPSADPDHSLLHMVRRGSEHWGPKLGQDPVTHEWIVEDRINYWCGNTWFPRFFPRQLPQYRIMPLESYLAIYHANLVHVLDYTQLELL